MGRDRAQGKRHAVGLTESVEVTFPLILQIVLTPSGPTFVLDQAQKTVFLAVRSKNATKNDTLRIIRIIVVVI
jgi:hypothetical protein